MKKLYELKKEKELAEGSWFFIENEYMGDKNNLKQATRKKLIVFLLIAICASIIAALGIFLYSGIVNVSNSGYLSETLVASMSEPNFMINFLKFLLSVSVSIGKLVA
jgi:hypothetical protein